MRYCHREMSRKLNLPLLVGIGLPALVVAVVLCAMYVPRLLAPTPTVDFLFATSNNYGRTFYAIVNGKLVERRRNKDYQEGSATLYRYSVPSGGAEPIGFPEAVKLKLNLQTISPDGYEFQGPDRGFGLFDLFGSGERDRAELRGHGTTWKLVGMPESSRYGDDCQFLGWIVQDGQSGPSR